VPALEVTSVELAVEEGIAMNDQGAAEASPGEVVVAYRDAVAVLSLLGEHDMTTAAELRAKIAEQAESGRGVVISVAETEFIDSAIIHSLYQGDRRLLARGRRLVLHLGGEPVVDRMLELAGILDELMWSVSLDDAVTYASQSEVLPDQPSSVVDALLERASATPQQAV
jgi:anti-anti-sigma factor